MYSWSEWAICHFICALITITTRTPTTWTTHFEQMTRQECKDSHLFLYKILFFLCLLDIFKNCKVGLPHGLGCCGFHGLDLGGEDIDVLLKLDKLVLAKAPHRKVQ